MVGWKNGVLTSADVAPQTQHSMDEDSKDECHFLPLCLRDTLRLSDKVSCSTQKNKELITPQLSLCWGQSIAWVLRCAALNVFVGHGHA